MKTVITIDHGSQEELEATLPGESQHSRVVEIEGLDTNEAALQVAKAMYEIQADVAAAAEEDLADGEGTEEG